jgi:hypothetical protein
MSCLWAASAGFCSPSLSVSSSYSSLRKNKSPMMTSTISAEEENSYVSLSRSKWWWSVLVALMRPSKYYFFWSTDSIWYSVHDATCCPRWWLRYLNGANGFVKYWISLRCLRFRPATPTSTTWRPSYRQNKHRTDTSPWESIETTSRAKSSACDFWKGVATLLLLDILLFLCKFDFCLVLRWRQT